MARPETLLLLLLGTGACIVYACNNAICGPRVSKCMLIKCCGCDMSDLKNCTCCRDCQVCLKSLYTECCSCVGLCPPPDPEDDLAKTSSVEDLPDPIPDLFDVLTEEEDHFQRWSTYTFAVDLDKLLFKPGGAKSPNVNMKIIQTEKEKEPQRKFEPSEEDDAIRLGIRNCTVAFFSECMSMGKCKASCRSMGAAKYRWFHEHGCCQCVGSSCFDYGLSNPQCLRCPETAGFKERYMFEHKENSMYHSDGYDKVGMSQAFVDTV
ncbi:twisted gastrulation protein homolog 1-A [Aplysia californica]|uniref:Twisted gastrulation protein homolog 1-A n=1 Tax=Aplysia californica TaxID=6500 RepID=A0ABM0JCI2_APLCA|nr:twisted gastrulation protein homolog 1-A [Aplysia californica]